MAEGHIASEVEVGRAHGLPEMGVITCDNILTVSQASLDRERIGALGPQQRAELDRALCFALDIVY